MSAAPALVMYGDAQQCAFPFPSLPLLAVEHIRPMKGGAQSHVLIASDGNAYVTKFRNNPQAERALANEWLACRIGRELGLSIPEPAIISVTPEFVDAHPALVMRVAGRAVHCSPGLAFGSRVVSLTQPLFDYLPETLLSGVANPAEFAGVLALDKWLCNCDGRQVVFCCHGRTRKLRAHWIDFGFCFNADEWSFPDSPLRGIYSRNSVYDCITGWESFEPWLSRIESFPVSTLAAIGGELPGEWVQHDALASLLANIYARRTRVRDLIADVQRSPRAPFANWTELPSRFRPLEVRR